MNQQKQSREKTLSDAADYLEHALDYLHESRGFSYTDITHTISLLRTYAGVVATVGSLALNLPVLEGEEPTTETVVFASTDDRRFLPAERINELLKAGYRVRKDHGYYPLNPSRHSITRGPASTVQEAWWWCHNYDENQK